MPASGIDLGAVDLDGSMAKTLYAHEREHAGDALLSVRLDGEWQDLTVAETTARVRAVAAGLLGAGLRPGDRLAVMSRSRLEWTLCDYAAATVGVVTVPIYETSSDEQVRWVLADSGAAAVCCETTSLRDRIEGLRAELPSLGQLWCFEDGGIDAIVAAGARVPAADVEARLAAVKGDDLMSIVYTSGTTGRPKGCMLTHANCLSDLVGLLELLAAQLHPQASTLLFLPMAHIFGRAVEFGAIATRTRLGYCPDPATLPDDLLSFRPTFLLAVPRVFEKVFNAAKTTAHERPAGAAGYRGRVTAALTGRLFDDGEETAIAWSKARAAGRVPAELRARHAFFDQLVYSKLRAALGGRVTYALSAGAPLGARLGHFFDGIGVTVLEVYGLTETIGATFNPPDALRIGTVGRPIPGMELRLDADGEVLLRGPNVFVGYWHNPAATADAFDDGWFRTGDVGSVDADGYLSITGRKKELLVTAAGKNVAPAPLEDRLRSHPLISQCMVVGEGRPYVAALVTLDAEAWPAWAAARTGHGRVGPLADHLEDPEVVAEIQRAVDQANRAVSRAESIRRFLLLPDDFTQESGELTPTLKLRRAVIHAQRAEAIERLYR